MQLETEEKAAVDGHDGGKIMNSISPNILGVPVDF